MLISASAIIDSNAIYSKPVGDLVDNHRFHVEQEWSHHSSHKLVVT